MRSRTRALTHNKFAALPSVVGGVNASDAARIFTSAAQLKRAVPDTLAASVRGRETCAHRWRKPGSATTTSTHQVKKGLMAVEAAHVLAMVTRMQDRGNPRISSEGYDNESHRHFAKPEGSH